MKPLPSHRPCKYRLLLLPLARLLSSRPLLKGVGFWPNENSGFKDEHTPPTWYPLGGKNLPTAKIENHPLVDNDSLSYCILI